MKEDLILWGDIETTGLDPVTDVILEVGLRVTDRRGVAQYRTTELIWTPDWRSRLARNEYVLNMHEQSGLIHDLEDLSRSQSRYTQSRETVSRRLAAWVAEKTGGAKLPFAGNSVTLDKFFLHFHMPELRDAMHYRIFDMSSTREQMRVANRPLFDKLPPEPKVHRPQADIDSSIKLWHFFNEHFFWTYDDDLRLEMRA